MNKERLEEIEGKYTILPVSSKQDGFEYTEVVVEDLVFLIQNGFKQAERVQELEDALLQCAASVLKQNKRYREALEQIANSDGWLIEPNPLCTIEEAYERCVDTACRALESEE